VCFDSCTGYGEGEWTGRAMKGVPGASRLVSDEWVEYRGYMSSEGEDISTHALGTKHGSTADLSHDQRYSRQTRSDGEVTVGRSEVQWARASCGRNRTSFEVLPRIGNSDASQLQRTACSSLALQGSEVLC
jgi:hypothetical protein